MLPEAHHFSLSLSLSLHMAKFERSQFRGPLFLTVIVVAIHTTIQDNAKLPVVAGMLCGVSFA